MDTTLVFEAIGTRWQIEYDVSGASAKDTMVRGAIDKMINDFDHSFSRFRDDSWVSQVRTSPGTYELPADGYELLCLYQKAYLATDGLVTPLIGSLLEQAGYDAQYSLRSTQLSAVPAFSDVVSFTKISITTTAAVLLDFGAAGKGYLVDMIGALLRGFGIVTFVINAGGDILHSGSGASAITVGLENPFDMSQAIGTCEVSNGSLCASAGSRRKWENFTHIINPKTQTSPHSIAGIWVKADTAAQADMVATALFFVAPDRLLDYFQFDYALLDDKMQLLASPGFGVRAFIGEPA